MGEFWSVGKMRNTYCYIIFCLEKVSTTKINHLADLPEFVSYYERKINLKLKLNKPT